ncbi:hypothetical protein [Fictibacillus norfolkensis]|uniref:Uncharacterized protein n=1 Tax=Fictibacillus norfolkensis TaxID=2762233 RepID=A0ABR8SN25_9BACL|nr:hypothetical protein [Fictibacillus norfolkensis]MBD7964898.1 hypothetical protein [Fictibacillus norfolkensis]
MSGIVTRIISAMASMGVFLVYLISSILKDGNVGEIIAIAFWLGIVGFIITLVYGSIISIFIEWLLKLIKIDHKYLYYILFIVLHALGGSITHSIFPLLGNIVALFYAIFYLLLKNNKTKEVLYSLAVLVVFISNGIWLESKFNRSSDLSFGYLWNLYTAILIGAVIIIIVGLKCLKTETWIKSIIMGVSIAVVTLPSVFIITTIQKQVHHSFEQDKELYQLYKEIKKEKPEFLFDPVRSFENGYTLSLAIMKKEDTQPSSKKVLEFVEWLPKREEGYYLQIYYEEEFLYLTLDSMNNIIECDNPNAAKSMCSKLAE